MTSLRVIVRAILGVALLVGWMGCASNEQSCGAARACPADNVCASTGVCLQACGTDGATCPAGLTCTTVSPYCAASPCDAAASVLACIAGFSPGGY